MKATKRALLLGLVWVHTAIRIAHADSPPDDKAPIARASYDAFDLVDRKLEFQLADAEPAGAAIKSIELSAPGSSACQATHRPGGPGPRQFTITLDTCSAILQQVVPGPLNVKLELAYTGGKTKAWAGVIAFDGGMKLEVRTSYDSRSRTLNLGSLRAAAGVPFEVAFYSAINHQWERKIIDKETIIPYDRQRGVAFAWLSPNGPWIRIAFDATRDNLRPFDCSLYYNHPKLGSIYRNIIPQPHCVDQANLSATPTITLKQHDVVPPNNYQILIVRHWDDVVPILTYSGTGVGLTAPSFAKIDSSVQAAVIKQEGLLQGRSVIESHPGEGYEISAFWIAPHAPGYSHFTLAFASLAAPAESTATTTDPAGGGGDKPDSKGKAASEAKTEKPAEDKKDATELDDKPVTSAAAETRAVGFDVITDDAYSGALRLGVGWVQSDDVHRYISYTPPGGTQAQIKRIDSQPLEIALGYSIYSDIFTGGRTYNITYGDSKLAKAGYWLLRHTSLYAGVGVVGYDGAKLDYLQSLYFGGELNINRNISLGLAWNIRRNERLADQMIGGPVPPSGIQTRSETLHSWAVILNVTSEFFEFAKGVVKR